MKDKITSLMKEKGYNRTVASAIAYKMQQEGNLSKEQADDVEKQRTWLNNWNKNRVVNGEKLNSGLNIPSSDNINIKD